jgi:archaeal flagellar protein FlaE
MATDGTEHDGEGVSTAMRGFHARGDRSADWPRRLLFVENAVDHDMAKPYLTALPQSYAAELLVFEWLTFLVEAGGTQGMEDAFRFYQSIDWLTEEAEDGLREYVHGLDDDDAEDAGSLSMDDHIESLIYITRLASMHPR